MSLLRYSPLLLLLLIASYFLGRSQAVPPAPEKQVETRVEQVEVTKWRTRVVTQPDGTRVEETTGEKSEKREDRAVLVESPKSQYRVGVRAQTEWEKWTPPTFSIEVGRRIAGPAWVDVGINPRRREVSIGVSIEF